MLRKCPFLFFLKGLLFSILLSSFNLKAAEEQHKNKKNALSNEDITDPFFRIFEEENLKSARSQCMSGERFTQSYSGNSHSRSVGRMSNGYFYGMMMSFAKNVCSQKENNLNKKLRETPGISSLQDALNHYGSKVQSLSDDPLIQNYSLLLPLGMIESSGMYGEGRDKSSSNVSANTAEAGLFQVSYDSTKLGAQSMKNVYEELLEKYKISNDSDLQNNSSCMTGIFSLNQRTSRNTESYGGGEGLRFQRIMKMCPALAVDYMAALLRTNKNHNGPLRRKEAQPRESCVYVLTTLKNHLSKGNNCASVGILAASFPNDPRAKAAFAVAEPINRGELAPSRSKASLYDSAEESRAQADELEKDQEALKKAGLPEEAEKLNQQIASLKKNAEAIENDEEALKAKIKQVEASLPEIEKQIKRSQANDSIYREEATDLRRQASIEKNPLKKAELEKQAEEKDKLAKQYKENAEKLTRELEKQKQLIDELKKKEEELKKKKIAQLESIKLRLKTLDAEIRRLKSLQKKSPEEEAEIKAKVDEAAKLKEELSRLESKN